MNFYISSRVANQKKVKEIKNYIIEKGHEVKTDWTEHTPPRPYDFDVESSGKYAIKDINASMNCDVFILLTSESGTGMYAEFGSAIANSIKEGKPKIYVIGDYLSRSMFFFHPLVIRKEKIEEVFIDLGI